MGTKETNVATVVAQSADEESSLPAVCLTPSPPGSIRNVFLTTAASDEGADGANPAGGRPTPPAGRCKTALALATPPCLLLLVWWSWAMAATWAGGAPLPGLFMDAVGARGAPAYVMSAIMLLGSMLSGATLDGSVAVAFPSATLAAGLDAIAARDFAIMTNAAGMTSFAASMLLMGRKHDVGAVAWCSAGGAAGVVAGMAFVAPELGVEYAEMAFPSLWLAFAFALFVLNRGSGRGEGGRVGHLSGADLGVKWRPTALLAAGFCGGVLTSVFGSGGDVAVFLVLTVVFRVSDELAGPTSVAVMAASAWTGVLYRQAAGGGAGAEAWRLFGACAPVVAVAMPLGFVAAFWTRRRFVRLFVYLVAAAQLAAAWVVVEPWRGGEAGSSMGLIVTSVGIAVSGAGVVVLVDVAGRKLRQEERRMRVASLERMAEKKVDERPASPTTSSFVLAVWRIPDEEGGEAAVQYV
eukprot:evm.model.scf_2830.2 EVM.evm.TU.scf_2830.2   scf_2830:9985-11382(+)